MHWIRLVAMERNDDNISVPLLEHWLLAAVNNVNLSRNTFLVHRSVLLCLL